MSKPSATRVAYQHLTARPRESADERYHHHLVNVHESLGNIKKALAKHIRDQSRKPTDWGFVGDMEKVSEDLEDIETFLR